MNGTSVQSDVPADVWQRLLGDLLPCQTALAGLSQHWTLVRQWNARTNLTAITDTEAAIVRHYRDSLMALPHLSGGPLVDFGSGAGFPGMVLALARPDWYVTLVEPRRKRVSFLEVARARLQLRNVTIHHGRLEDAPDKPYKHALSRATFADAGLLPMAQVHAHVGRWLAPQGTLLLYRSEMSASRNAAAVDAPAMRTPAAAEHPYVLPATPASAQAARTLMIWSAPQLRGDNRTIAPMQGQVV